MNKIIKILSSTITCAATSLIATCLLWSEPIKLTIIILLISFAMLIREHRKDEILLFFIMGIAGASAEITAIYYGAWNYTISNFARIPFWLPPLWGIAAIVIKRTANKLKE